MKIHCFGDSWTDGIGVELEPGSGPLPSSERYDKDWSKEKNIYSWPGQLHKFLNYKYKVNNFGVCGYSNLEIYKDLFDKLKYNTIQKGDLVIVCFSSIIREPLNFLTLGNGENNYGFISYSNKVRERPPAMFPHYIEQIENKDLKEATIDMYMDFVVNRFNFEFLYEISMNYVINLQIMFESLGINYLFVNAFENILSEKSDLYNKVKKENWILLNYTLSEYLADRKGEIDNSLPYSLYEDDFKDVERCADGPHPNRIGYQFIAELISKEILKRNIISDASFI